MLRQIISEVDGLNRHPLEDLLAATPRLDELTDVPAGTPVLVRADIDVRVKDGKVADITRLETCAETLRYCQSRGWITIVFGHLGRKKEATTEPVAAALNDKFGLRFRFIDGWLDEEAAKLSDQFVETVQRACPGDQFLLQNTRRYDLERALWTATPETLSTLSPRMLAICSDIRTRLSSVFVNEAIAASNLDFSSCAVPLLMERTAFGFYIASEIREQISRVRNADFVVFSGLKIDKLNDLEGIIDRGHLRLIITAGSLAMALRKARAQLNGGDFFLGRAETETDYPAYISAERVEQAQRILQKCAARQIEVILPVDYILDDLTISRAIPDGRAQMDIGPETRTLIADVVRRYIATKKQGSAVMFYNGVFGKVEDADFQNGTRDFIPLLKELTQSGVLTFVGGGEGRTALKDFGALSDVTHAFTCGGTVLKSLTDRHIGFLKAMYLQNRGRITSFALKEKSMHSTKGDTASLIEEFRNSLRSQQLQELADVLADTPGDDVTAALLERLGSDQVQDDPDVENAVCTALVKRGIMRELGNLNYRFEEPSLLPPGVRSQLMNQEPIRSKYGLALV